MAQPDPLTLRFDRFDLDEANARLSRDGQPIALTPKAFDVLCALARAPGQLMSKDALLDAVWGHRHVSESVLKTIVSELRGALGDDAKQPRYIETASRRGYRFIGAIVDAAVPAPATGEPPPRMIGRKRALEQLRALWQKALAGQRQVVWIVGDAGVGKTTLIRNFLAEVDPSYWWHGQCVEQFGAGEPYLPLLEALTYQCRRDPNLPAMLRAGAPTWFLQLPQFCSDADRAQLRQALAGANQERMMRELREATDIYSQQWPLLFVTEDLHWSDRSTLQMMNYLARSGSSARAMWLATFRPTEVAEEGHPLRAIRHELKLQKSVTEIVLDAFSEQEVAFYIESRLPHAVISEHFVRKLHARTDGLPLFVANVIEDMVSQGVLSADGSPPDDAEIDALQVPESLAGVIEKQLARLPVDLRKLLETAATCGTEFRAQTLADAMHLARATGEPALAWVSDRCDELAAQKQWISAEEVTRLADGTLDARYRFRHAVYRHVLYQRTGVATRALIHKRVAESLLKSRDAGIPVAPTALAAHLEQSLDYPSAVREYSAAAESALRRYAPSEAMALTAHALALLPKCPPGVERLEHELALIAPRSVACSQLLGIGSPESRAVFAHAEKLCAQLPDSPVLGWVLSGIGWMRCISGEYDESRRLAGRISALADTFGEVALRVSASALIGTCAAFQGAFAEACEWLERGLKAADALEPSAATRFAADPVVWIQSSLAICQFQMGRAELSAANLAAAVRRAESGGPLDQLQALRCAGAIEVWRDHPERVTEIAAKIGKLHSERAVLQAQWPAKALAGWALARTSDPQAGYAMIMEGVAVMRRIGMVGGSTLTLAFAADALARAARWDEAQAHLDEAQQLAERTGERLFYPQILLERGRIEAQQGKVDQARATIETSLREARKQGARALEAAAQAALEQL